MKIKRFLIFLFVFANFPAMTQDIWDERLPVVNIHNIQLRKVMYSFEKKAKKLGLISDQSPNYVRVLLKANRDGIESIELTVEDSPVVAFHRGDQRLHPFKACHRHNGCLFLFSGHVDSKYISQSGDSMDLKYSKYKTPPIFLLYPDDYSSKLTQILLESQSCGTPIEEPYRSYIIRSLECGASKRLMKEWWSISWKKRHKDNQWINIPRKNDLLLYHDDGLTVYARKR